MEPEYSTALHSIMKF